VSPPNPAPLRPLLFLYLLTHPVSSLLFHVTAKRKTTASRISHPHLISDDEDRDDEDGAGGGEDEERVRRCLFLPHSFRLILTPLCHSKEKNNF
jgi:hypothetical protein